MRAAAQQMALPPRRIGACQPSSGRRWRVHSRRKPFNLRASFTSLVADIATNPRVLLGEVAVVVLFSGIFEKLEHKIRHKLKRSGQETGAQIIDALFKEITVLGFVAFMIFLMTHTGPADALAPKILRCDAITVHGHNPLSATFETVHMMIFLLLVVLLAQAAGMYLVSERICRRWGGFERTVSYGAGKASMESKFVEAGYLKRVPDTESPRGVRLEQVKPFTYGANLIQRLFMRGRPLHKLLMWRAIRHEFLFPSAAELDGKSVAQVPDPSLFSMEDYLRARLGKVVLSLIHIDRWTWVVTLGLLAAPLYICKTFPWISNELVHCIMAWSIALIGVGLALILERDTFQLTPKVPQDVPQTLKLFSGESFQMLRRAKLPGWRDRPLEFDSEATRMPLELPEALLKKKKGFFSSKGYSHLFRMVSFFQAVSFTSLILSHLSAPFTSSANWIWYVAALVEWPVFLFVIVPVLVRRLTIRSSIAHEKDPKVISKVTTETKEGLLRDYARLVQVSGFEARSRRAGEPWTADGGGWTSKEAIQTVLAGLKKFDGMPPTEKREIWAMFAAWDANNSGAAEPREFVEAFKSMGNEKAQDTVDSLMRLVDFDGAKTMNWMKFKALYGLALADQTEESMRADFEDSFNIIDADGNGELTIFELSKGFSKMNLSIGSADIANLLFLYFGEVKPTVTSSEFVEWVVTDRRTSMSSLAFNA